MSSRPPTPPAPGRGATLENPVLLVEDDPSVARAVSRLLGTQVAIRVAHSVGEASRFLESARDLSAAVLDYQLPDGTSLELIDLIRARRPWMPVLVFTGSDNPRLPNAVQERGAMFANKPIGLRNLTALLMRAKETRPGGRQLVADYLRDRGLTKRQVEVLHAALAQPRRRDAAEALGISDETLKSLLSAIFRKCEVSGMRDLARKIIAMGD